MDDRDTFMGIGSNRLVRWDMRAPSGIVADMGSPSVLNYKAGHDYKTKTDFQCIATSGECPPVEPLPVQWLAVFKGPALSGAWLTARNPAQKHGMCQGRAWSASSLLSCAISAIFLSKLMLVWLMLLRLWSCGSSSYPFSKSLVQSLIRLRSSLHTP